MLLSNESNSSGIALHKHSRPSALQASSTAVQVELSQAITLHLHGQVSYFLLAWVVLMRSCASLCSIGRSIGKVLALRSFR
jgi:hypothetical protein